MKISRFERGLRTWRHFNLGMSRCRARKSPKLGFVLQCPRQEPGVLDGTKHGGQHSCWISPCVASWRRRDFLRQHILNRIHPSQAGLLFSLVKLFTKLLLRQRRLPCVPMGVSPIGWDSDQDLSWLIDWGLSNSSVNPSTQLSHLSLFESVTQLQLGLLKRARLLINL